MNNDERRVREAAMCRVALASPPTSREVLEARIDALTYAVRSLLARVQELEKRLEAQCQ